MSTLYPRHVPSKPQTPSSPPTPPPQQARPSSAEASQEGKKRKRTGVDDSNRKAPKQERKKTKKPAADSDDAVKQDAGSSSTNADVASPGKQNKEAKGKKDAVMQDEEAHQDQDQGQDHDAQEDSDQVISKKHSGVFSKFQKAAQLSAKIQATAGDDDNDDDDDQDQDLASEPELHDLTPLPQPKRKPTPDYLPTFSAVPDWLAHPIVVSQTTTKPFDELSLSAKTVAQLASKGWNNAFAVQAALLPLLLPHPCLSELPPNDVCVSAPTGSGKTLAYVLPIIEALRTRSDTKLRALIVVPTRELVQQAHHVALTCAAGTRLRVATAVGAQNLQKEQASLVKRGRRYDPDAYKNLMRKAKKRLHYEDDSDSDETTTTTTTTAATAAKNSLLDDVVQTLPDHVPTYTSAIDVLICTPGRLVEHMNSTVGFNLDDVEWLVIDEADRLLDQSFQEWVAKVVGALELAKPDTRVAAVEQELGFALKQSRHRYVRKVILSATMTRDIAKLSSLNLRRPSLIEVKSGNGQDDDDDDDVQKTSRADGAEVYQLPATLSEYAVPVGDGLDKPLFLLHLLKTRILSQTSPKSGVDNDDDDDTSSSDEDSSSDNDSDSSDSSDTSSEGSASDSSDSESDSDSDESDESDTEDDSDDSSDSSDDDDDTLSTSSAAEATPKPTTAPSTHPMVLIFTGSTEEAARLHHLLTHLEPAYAPQTILLTKASAASASSLARAHARNRSSGSSNGNGPATLIISTDRASRGLDLPDLTHVVNYHMPRSVATYVHRVGRTARAGRRGAAWTLFQETQGRWFWRAVARSGGSGAVGAVVAVARGRHGAEVERVNLKLADADGFGEGGEVRTRYEAVLAEMRDLVRQEGSAGKKSSRD